MRIKYSVLMQAMKQFGYSFSSYLGEHVDDQILDIELVEEDPGAGSMIECVRLSNTLERLDKYTNKNISTTRIVEIYDESSQQGAKLIKQEVQVVESDGSSQ